VVAPHLAGATAADQAAPEHQAAIERLIIALNNGAYDELDASSLRTTYSTPAVNRIRLRPRGVQAASGERAGDRVVDAVRARGVMATADQVAAR